MANHPWIVLVGGFLGSGKTTLLLEAARRLTQAGSRVAIITNDQGGALVDTQLAETSGIDTEEIIGGCFCCRFSSLLESADRLRLHNPDVILAEPVGSCIDISATVIQPLKRFAAGSYRLAPFTVLVDPQRAAELLAPDADPHLAYLFNQQLAEADLVCFNKSDLHQQFPELPIGAARRISAATGQGVSEWLTEILAGSHVSGARLLENVDYQYYAEAEAALGWLNWQTQLRLTDLLSPAQVVGPFLEHLDQKLAESGIPIAHLKVLDQTGAGYVKASLCRSGQEPSVQGTLDASPVELHQLTVNLRASGPPDQLEAAVKHAAANLPGLATVLHFECFRPSPPKPEFRLSSTSA